MKIYLRTFVLLLVILLLPLVVFADENLNWTPSSDSVVGYTMYFDLTSNITDATNKTQYSKNKTVESSVVSISLSDLNIPYNVSITYIVVAYNDAGTSEASNVVVHIRKYVPPDDIIFIGDPETPPETPPVIIVSDE